LKVNLLQDLSCNLFLAVLTVMFEVCAITKTKLKLSLVFPLSLLKRSFGKVLSLVATLLEESLLEKHQWKGKLMMQTLSRQPI